MATVESNAINASTTGIVGNTGTSFTATAATQYNVIVGGSTTSTLGNVAHSSTSGVPLVSGGSSANPSFTTAVVAGGGTGNTTQAAYSVVCGGTSTTGAFQAVGPASTGEVLISGGASALPSFSAYPQVSGLGVGASPGSTAGITFDGSNFLNAYSTGTWTPTVDGSVSGTTSYTSQTGYYTIIGNHIFLWARIIITAMTGTGNLVVAGFPQTIKNQDTYQPVGVIQIFSTGFTYPTGTTCVTVNGIQNSTNGTIQCQGSTHSNTQLQAANTAATIQYNLDYQF
jgi:hypothetical protein